MSLSQSECRRVVVSHFGIGLFKSYPAQKYNHNQKAKSITLELYCFKILKYTYLKRLGTILDESA